MRGRIVKEQKMASKIVKISLILAVALPLFIYFVVSAILGDQVLVVFYSAFAFAFWMTATIALKIRLSPLSSS